MLRNHYNGPYNFLVYFFQYEQFSTKWNFDIVLWMTFTATHFRLI